MSVTTTRLHGIIDRLKAISDELYDMQYHDSVQAVDDAIEQVREDLEEARQIYD